MYKVTTSFTYISQKMSVSAMDNFFRTISRAFTSTKNYLWENIFNSPPAFVTDIMRFFQDKCCCSGTCRCCSCCCTRHTKRKKSIENIERIINEKEIIVNNTSLVEFECEKECVNTPVLSLDIIDEM